MTEFEKEIERCKEHERYAEGLRQLADFYEEHPEVPLPAEEALSVYSLDTKEEAQMLAKAFGTFEKDATDYYFSIIKRFGPINLRFVFSRSKVCTKKVVGVRTIEARFVEAHTEPARTEEIVEWDCPTLLDGGSESLTRRAVEAAEAQTRG